MVEPTPGEPDAAGAQRPTDRWPLSTSEPPGPMGLADWVFWIPATAVLLVIVAGMVVTGLDIKLPGGHAAPPPELPSTAYVEKEFLGTVLATVDGAGDVIVPGGSFMVLGTCLGSGQLIIVVESQNPDDEFRRAESTRGCTGVVLPGTIYPGHSGDELMGRGPYVVSTQLTGEVTKARVWVLVLPP
jgi:hypothetical protein